MKTIARDTYPIGADWATLEIPTPEHMAWLEDTLGRLGLDWYGDLFLTLLAGRTAREIVRIGSSQERYWGTVIVSNWGWTLYYGCDEIAHAEWRLQDSTSPTEPPLPQRVANVPCEPVAVHPAPNVSRAGGE